ncbi:MAG: glycosyltransferase family 4 protein [Maricaulaceae bacterium]
MNVLQLTPELNAGGVERTTLEVAEALIAAGHRAHVVSAGGRMEGELTQMGAQLHRMDIGSKNILTYGQRVRALKTIIKEHKIDIVHARSRAPAWPARAAAKAMGVPFLATYHGIYNANSALKRGYNAVMTKGALTIANSNMTKAHIIKEHKLDADKIVVIQRGVDLTQFDPAKIKANDITATRKSWGAKADETLLLLPGRLTTWKGQAVAIKALAQLQNLKVKLVIMGDAQGRDAYVDGLKKLVARFGLEARCTFADHNLNMPLMIAASDMVLSTSIEPEAFGRVAVEAQAMGKPILASAHGGSLETVLDGQTGLLVSPNDPQALASAINTALTSTKGHTPRTNLSEYNPNFARTHVTENFSKTSLQVKTLAVYDRLLTASSV